MQKDMIKSGPQNMVEANQKLRENDKAAWEWLYNVAKMFFQKWCDEERIEITWIVENERLCPSKKSVYQSAFEKIRQDHLEKQPGFEDAKDMKMYMYTIFKEYINNGFGQFVQGLIIKADLVWNFFYNKMFSLLSAKVYMTQKMPIENSRDICQDTLATFSEKIPEKNVEDFPTSGALKGFVYSIASFKIKEFFTRSSRYTKRFERIESYERFELPDNHYYFENSDNKESVAAMLSMLGKTEYEILVRNYVEGFELKEIAEQLNKTPGNIRQIKLRAIEKLRENMKTSNLQYF